MTHQQVVFVRLRESETDVVIETQTVEYKTNIDSHFDYGPKRVQFHTQIKPETNYTLNIWSVNKFGESDHLTIQLQTPKQPQLIVSSDDISIDGSTLTAHFSVELNSIMDKLEYMGAVCCAMFSHQCQYVNNEENNPDKPIVFKEIPNTTAYFILFGAYAGIFKYQHPCYYFSEGIMVTRTENNLSSAGKF